VCLADGDNSQAGDVDRGVARMAMLSETFPHGPDNGTGRDRLRKAK
jgi:hypothetical protein